jgi:hypothetical protein
MAAAEATAGGTGVAQDRRAAAAPLEAPSSLAARTARSVALVGDWGALLASSAEGAASSSADPSLSSLSSQFKRCKAAYRRRKISSLAKPL